MDSGYREISLGRFCKDSLNGNLGLMKFSSLRYSVLAALLLTLTGQSAAIGLGELHLHSAIGQPLRASIALEGTDGGLPGIGCFRADSMGSDAARLDTRLRIVHRNSRATLEITSRQTINEPVLTLLVAIACDSALQREYTLLPDFPVDRNSDANITMGSSTTPPASAEAGEPPPRPTVRRKPRTTLMAGDRLLLSAAPTDLSAPTNNPPDALPEMAHRMLRMETELRHLGQSLAALDEAVRLGEQKANVRQELRIAESLQAAHIAPAPPSEIGRSDSLAPWLQMTGSALLGGLLSVGLLQLAERRRKSLRQPT